MQPSSGLPLPCRLHQAALLSIALHAAVLLIPRQSGPESRPVTSLQARLQGPVRPEIPVVAANSSPKRSTSRSSAQVRPILTVPKSAAGSRIVNPVWSKAEKAEMSRFLDSIGSTQSLPTLAERSLAMAGQMARQEIRASESSMDVVERLPNSPPIDAFGLEMYMEALVKKLNRSAAYVKNDVRAQGMKVAAVQVRLNPNGSLNSFRVLNAADQQEEIDFIRRVVEQAVPFAAFPADLQRSARSLSMLICIRPAGAGGGFGFSRQGNAHSC